MQSALVLAVLGAIDSLLTSLIADNVTRTYHDSDRELIGQGIGNTIAGAFGGIPGAGATMRTVVNVRTGGRTPISGALHALVLLAIVLGLSGLAEHIPHAVLAGILIKVGVDIIDWTYLKRIHRAPRAGVFFMLVVLLLTVFVDLITAVAVGIVLASLLYVKRMSDLQLSNITAITRDAEAPILSPAEHEALAAGDGRVILYHLSGPFSFGAAKGMARRLASGDHYDALVLDLVEVNFIDSSAALALGDAILTARAGGKRVFLVGRPQAGVRRARRARRAGDAARGRIWLVAAGGAQARGGRGAITRHFLPSGGGPGIIPPPNAYGGWETRTLEIQPLSSAIGAEILGVDLARPSDGDFGEFHQALLDPRRHLLPRPEHHARPEDRLRPPLGRGARPPLPPGLAGTARDH